MEHSERNADMLGRARLAVAALIQQFNTLESTLLMESDAPLRQSCTRALTAALAAEHGLDRPTLRVATIGTTSAGKSTVVNALVGRKVAPMDNDELSAGVLRLVDTPHRSLHVEQAEGGVCDAIDKDNIDDEEIYDDLLEKVCKPYHAAKVHRTLPIPRAKVEGPLLPARWPALLGLPDGIGFEVLDLPGLNSIKDAGNLKLIQDNLKRCFSLVVLDYTQTDRATRAMLLDELRQVVDALGGRTEMMLFVLNRVDRRGNNDAPIEEYRHTLALEVAARLDIHPPPELIPLSALPLFYAQCAWGPTALTNAPSTTLACRQQHWDDFHDDCASLVRKQGRADPDVATFFDNHKDGGVPTDDDFHTWVRWVWDWSGGTLLLGHLQHRIEANFAELVIAPAVLESIATGRAFIEQAREACRVQRISTREALEEEQARLEKRFDDLEAAIAGRAADFRTRMGAVAEKLGAPDPAAVDEGIRTLFLGRPGEDGEAVRRVVRDTKGDLDERILVVLQKYFLDALATDALRSELQLALAPEALDPLVRAVDVYRGCGFTGDSVRLGMKLSAREDRPAEIASMDRAEAAAKEVFVAARRALAKRAEFVFRTKAHSLESALQAQVENEAEQLGVLTQDYLSAEGARALLTIFAARRAQAPEPTLPERLFELPTIKEVKKIIQVQNGTTVEVYETGTCFKDTHTRRVPVMSPIGVRSVELPSAEQMRQQLFAGVESTEATLWAMLGSSIKTSVDALAKQFIAAVVESREFLSAELQAQHDRVDRDCQLRLEEIAANEGVLADMAMQLEQLSAAAATAQA
jgi:hypothetical protein